MSSGAPLAPVRTAMFFRHFHGQAIKIPSKAFYPNTPIRVLLLRANDLGFGATRCRSLSGIRSFATDRKQRVENGFFLDEMRERLGKFALSLHPDFPLLYRLSTPRRSLVVPHSGFDSLSVVG